MGLIIELSYPVGYEFADIKHLTNNADINGQFIYSNIINFGGEQNYIVTIKLDDFANDDYVKFKNIAVKEMASAVRGTTDKNSLANPPAQMPEYTIQEVIDFVKSNFKENSLFSENVAKDFNDRVDAAYFSAVKRGDMETAQLMVENAAKRRGYFDDLDYQGSLAFNGAAPSKNRYYETKEERKSVWVNGDWVTPSKTYAEQHINLQDWESGRIIEQEVSIDDILKRWQDYDIDVGEVATSSGVAENFNGTGAKPPFIGPTSYSKIPQENDLSSDIAEENQENLKNHKRRHQQVNPIIQDGKVKDEYQDLLENKEYTPETIEQWDKKICCKKVNFS